MHTYIYILIITYSRLQTELVLRDAGSLNFFSVNDNTEFVINTRDELCLCHFSEGGLNVYHDASKRRLTKCCD